MISHIVQFSSNFYYIFTSILFITFQCFESILHCLHFLHCLSWFFHLSNFHFYHHHFSTVTSFPSLPTSISSIIFLDFNISYAIYYTTLFKFFFLDCFRFHFKARISLSLINLLDFVLHLLLNIFNFPYIVLYFLKKKVLDSILQQG